MPRVLRILNRLIIGGPALNATYLTKYMAPEWDTQLVIGGKDDHEQDATHLTERLSIEPLRVEEMKRAIDPVADRKAYLRMKAIIREFKPDVVHTHAAKSGAIGRLAAAACGVPVIVHTFHGHVFHSYFNHFKTQAFIRIERYLARRSSGIIAISEIQKHELADTYHIAPAGKISIIPLGFDLDRFGENQEAKRQTFRQRFGIAEDEIAVGIVGRIVPVKNHALFVGAVARLAARSHRKLRFVIVGDGDMRPTMEAQFREVGIDYTYFPEDPRAAQAICTSWQTEMDEVFAGLDIVALCSLNEGTPVSLIEAQAAARPVVSTAVGGVANVVTDGMAGFVTAAGDQQAFSDALFRLSEDEALRRQFGRFGHDFVAQRFSYQRLVTDMDAYYRKLLAASGRKHSL
ncbi:MAG: glycosyltransferase [Bacteroidetes bacterium]|nr:glycosyltransferase [Bacteroidota bacterium]